jgi:CheY-like chemotaxis protein
MRILIVDDEPLMVHTMAGILELYGHEVAQARSGAEALDLARQAPLHCAISDMRMPGMSGLELARGLRSLEPGLPVVLMSAYVDRSVVEACKQAGVLTVVEKPIDMDKLMDLLNNIGE